MITGNLQTKNGKYYAVLNLYQGNTRKPKWIPTGLETKGNKRKAESLLQQYLEEYEALELIRLGSADIMFADYMAQWLLSMKPTIATATFQSYKGMLKARVDPWFRARALKLNEVSPQDVQEFYSVIFDDGCTANTVIHYHAMLHKAFKSAVKKDLVSSNPTEKVDKPRKNHYIAAHCTEDEAVILLEAFQGDPLELAVIIAAHYGLRRSEVLGLRWSALDFSENTISVNHKVIEVEENGRFVAKGEDVLKTKSSHRTLPLIPVVRDHLLMQKERQDFYRRTFGRKYSKEYLDYVCTDELGVVLRPNYVTEHFAWMIEKYGLKKIRFHDLRHTCASLLLKNGVSMKQIQLWLGHSNFSTTADVYSHLDFAAHAESAAVMNSVYGKDKKANGQKQ